MERLRLGLVLLALAPVTWIVGIFVDGDTAYLPHLGLLLAGLAVAAWAVPQGRRPLGAFGFAVAALAIYWFYAWDLLSEPAAQAGGVFVLGCLVAAAGVLTGPRVLAVGLAIVALGGAYWTYVDGSNGQWIWVPGDVLTSAGPILAALGLAAHEEGP